MMHTRRYLLATAVVGAILPLLTQAQQEGPGEGNAKRFTISGNAGVPGAVMKGLPGDPITDARGNYAAQVAYGWSGTVTPAKEGHKFDPASKVYSRVIRDDTNEDYRASVLTFTLSGNAGIAGVEMRGLPGHILTDGYGNYRAEVPYGWSGTVTPMKPGCSFHPPSRTYQRVNANSEGNRYEVVSLRAVTPPSFAGDSSEVLVIPASGVDPKVVVQIKEDMQVMLEILREQLSEPRMIGGILTELGDYFGGQDSEAFYLEDYGVVFVIRVDFPLSSLPEEPPATEPGDDVDPVWQRARQKLYSPSITYRYGPGRRSGATEGISLEKFQEELLKALRHTANIRHVQDSSKIILTVVSQGAGGASYGYGGGLYGGGAGAGGLYEGGSSSVSGGRIGSSGGSTYSDSRVYSRGGTRSSTSRRGRRVPSGAAARSVLTIRASKTHVDAYARGDTSFEEFRQSVEIISY